MNGIEVILSKRLYKPGESIYGAIFYRQIHPSNVDSLTVQIRCTLKCSHQGNVIDECLFLSSAEVFHFESPYPIGYYVFPFKLNLPSFLDNSSYFSSPSSPSDYFILEYDVTASALSGSQTVFTSKSPFFAFSSSNNYREQESVNQTVRANKFSPEVCVTRRFLEPSVLQLDTAIKGVGPQKKVFSGFSLILTQKDSFYELGNPVTITASTSTSEHLHIDSVSYRLLRHVELNPTLCNLAKIEADSIKFSDVLFGVIRPAISDNAGTDRVELPLPPASFGECIWTTDEDRISCRYEVEVSISSSLESNLLSSSRASVECPPIIFTLPITVVPPKTIGEPSLPDWTSLCLVALAEDEWNASPRLSSFHSNPCQTVKISGGQRGSAGVSPRVVQENPEFRKIPVLRHLGATHF
ncbi:hypothetical protein Aperf_G00000074081 [Anoplocephala perfoliata]